MSQSYSATLFLRLLRAALVFSPSLLLAVFWVLVPRDTAHVTFLGHEVVTGGATLISVWVGLLAIANHRRSGDQYQRLLGIGYIAFAVIYASHVVLTRWFADDMALFLVFGPASRLVFALYMVAAIRALWAPSTEQPDKGSFRGHVLAIAGAVALVFVVDSSVNVDPWMVRTLEASSLVLFVVGLFLLRAIGGRGPYLLRYHRIALMLFLQASVGFLLSSGWNVVWWYAHAVSGAGFLVLAYAILVAYQRQGSFTTFFSEAELSDRLRSELRQSERLLGFLQAALDAVPAPTKVVRRQPGEADLTNRAWRSFVAEHGGEPGAVGVEDGGFGPGGLQETLLEKLGSDGTATHEYQCALEGEKRWFETTAQTLTDAPHGEGIVISHWDITTQVRARKELELLVDQKNELIATVSHEVRTPLTSIIGFLSLVRDETMPLEAAERVEVLDALGDQAEDINFLIEDLLYGTLVEAARVRVSLVPTQVSPLVREVANRTIRERPPTVEGPEVVALADPSRLRQVIRNLLTNANRYGGDNVRIVLSEEDDRVVISVMDDGEGVAPEHQESIFALYNDGADRDRPSGSIGVGLTMSRRLAEAMGGDLAYKRQDPWTVFELTLPTVPATGQSM